MRRDDYEGRVMRLKQQVAEGLKKSNKVKLGDGYLVRIPEIKGRISRITRNNTTYVEYIYERGYDPETGQSRNKKAIIGQIIDGYPNALWPNDNYEEYFDIDTGRLKCSNIEISDIESKQKESEASVSKKENDFHKSRANKQKKTAKESKSTDMLPPLTGTENPSELRARGIIVPWTPDEMTEEEKQQQKELMRKAGRDIYESIVNQRLHQQEEEQKEAERKRNLELYGEEFPDMRQPLSLEEWRKILIDDNEDEETDKDSVTATENVIDEQNTAESSASMENIFDEKELLENYDAIEAYRERIAILSDILKKIHESIKTQAKKHPDEIIGIFKAQKINRILQELKEKYEGTGYNDLLELIDEPHEVEKDEKTIVVGPTYSDVEVILDYYASILYFIKPKRQK